MSGAKTSTYHGGGLRRSSGDVPLLPVLLARNLGDSSSVVTGRLVFNRADGTVDRIELPQKTLEADETALMDARTAWGIVQEQAGDEGIGVEFEYTSAPGSVLMSAALVSGDRNLVFRVPLIDPETPKSSTGGYPWFAGECRLDRASERPLRSRLHSRRLAQHIRGIQVRIGRIPAAALVACTLCGGMLSDAVAQGPADPQETRQQSMEGRVDDALKALATMIPEARVAAFYQLVDVPLL